MAVSRVQFKNGFNTSASSLTVTFTSATTAGNLLLVMFSCDAGPSPTGVSLVGSSDIFTKDANVVSTNPTAGINLSLWSDPNCSGGLTQITATANSTGGLLVMAWEIAGAAISSPLAGAPGSAANPANTLQTSFDSTAGATVSSGCFWIGAVTGVGSGSRAAPSPSGSWTSEAQLQPGSLTDMLGAYQAGPAAGTPDFAGTFTAPVAGAYWAAIAAAYQPASSPATSTALLATSIV